MPVLTTAVSSRRPGSRASASAVPSPMPITAAISVAVTDTNADRANTSWMGSTIPSSTSLRHVGEEQRLTVLLDAEAADGLLHRCGPDPVRELLGAADVGVRAVPDHDHVVVVSQVG